MHPTLAGFYPFLLGSPARCAFLSYLCLYICLGSPARSRLSCSAVALTGALWLVQDYRALNAMTVKNKYPLPLISKLINKLRGAKYFTKLDVQWGFNNVQMKEGDEWEAAFCTNQGLFEPLVMFFGLCNSPATFQTMMDDIFDDLITEGVVVVLSLEFGRRCRV